MSREPKPYFSLPTFYFTQEWILALIGFCQKWRENNYDGGKISEQGRGSVQDKRTGKKLKTNSTIEIWFLVLKEKLHPTFLDISHKLCIYFETSFRLRIESLM